MNPVGIEYANIKLALAILTGSPIKVPVKEFESTALLADKQLKSSQNYSKAAIYLLSLLLIISLSQISAMKKYLISSILNSKLSFIT